MTSATPPSARGVFTGTRIAALLAVFALAGGAWAFRDRLEPGPASAGGDAPATFVAVRGPLSIQVVETGSIQAREQLVLKNEVEGQTTLLFLIPEGTVVKKGDLLAQLDGSRLDDERLEQQIKVQNADAAFVRARESLEVEKSEAESNISKDTLALQFAGDDLRKYVEGDYPNQVKEAEAKITLAEAELKRATEKLDWSRVLSKEKYVSATELEGDELAERKARLDLELARSALDLLRKFTHERTRTKLESDLSQAGLALERTRRKANADLIQAEADLRAKEGELLRQQTKLKKIEQQIEKTRIVAPRDGLVVYATSTQGGGGRGGGSEPLAEGQSIRERQELIKLPTAEDMMAVVKIHESRLDKVAPGLPVRLTIDALPGREFNGKVVRISPLPDPTNMWMNPDLKVYTTEIHIDGNGGSLRTGMSCQAQVLVAEYPDAVYVPVQAVLRQGSRALVWLVQQGKSAPREVEVGLDNNRMIHVKSGLQAGDVVLLAPPLEAGARDAIVPAGGAALTPSNQPVGKGAAPSGEPVPAAANAPERTPSAGGEGKRSGGRMSPEEREAFKKRMESMSPEEQEKMREQFRNRRPRGEGSGDGEGGSK